MFKGKYNPDIDNLYNKNLKYRNGTNYKLENTPYKLILEDDIKNIRTTDDLRIKIKEDNSNITKIYEGIIKERKINANTETKNLEKVKENFDIKNMDLSLKEDFIPNDFEDMKDEFTSEFKEQQNEIEKDRNNFNDMLESLLEDGILD
tara:strand:+ start:365 stop:808 length:444 start_codon:yes stop_codon:yes gene_type:complete